MHVTIAYLNSEASDSRILHEDSVFERNESLFPDGVTAHADEDEFKEDIERIVEWFGDAAAYEDKDGKHKLTIKHDKIRKLFEPYWKEFQESLQRLHDYTFDNFVTSRGIATELDRLNEAFKFDWLYILDDMGVAEPISEWLHDLARSEEPESTFYIVATYDGDQ